MSMNTPQKKACFLFSLFLLIVGVIFLAKGHSLSTVIAIFLSGVGFYFFFSSEDKPKTNAGATKLSKNIKRSIVIVILVAVGISVILGIGYIIDEQARLKNDAILRDNAKYVEIEHSILRDIKASYSATQKLTLVLKNNSNKVVENVDVFLSYYTPSGYFIRGCIISNATNSAIIAPNSLTLPNAKEIYLDPPNQAHKTTVRVHKVYFRKNRQKTIFIPDKKGKFDIRTAKPVKEKTPIKRTIPKDYFAEEVLQEEDLSFLPDRAKVKQHRR